MGFFSDLKFVRGARSGSRATFDYGDSLSSALGRRGNYSSNLSLGKSDLMIMARNERNFEIGPFPGLGSGEQYSARGGVLQMRMMHENRAKKSCYMYAWKRLMEINYEENLVQHSKNRLLLQQLALNKAKLLHKIQLRSEAPSNVESSSQMSAHCLPPDA